MNLDVLSDRQILSVLGERLEGFRLAAGIPDKEIFSQGGVKKDALANFKKGRNVSLLNFIKILRGLGLLSLLLELIPEQDNYSPMDELNKKSQKQRKRIRSKSKQETDTFKWGDET